MRRPVSSLLVLALLAALPALAEPPVFTDGGFAIRGYDPVAYFDSGAPTKGKESIRFEWNGATWLFASEEHKEAFASDPDKYAPQFGGYCAYAVAKGSTAAIDPEAWKIVDGKLYLNYSQRIQKKWQEDVAGYIAKAEANWPEVLN